MRTMLLLLVATAAAGQSPLDQLGWMAGCWESPNRAVFEMWSPPAGGLMVGAGRTVSRGQARAFEHLRLRADGAQVVYTAIPSGQVETDFRSSAVSADGFTVENPSHDFPTRIIYRRTGPDAMSVRVEGPGPDGPRGFEIAFTRIRCEAASPTDPN